MAETKELLIVEDDPNDRFLIAHALKNFAQGVKFDFSDCAEDAWVRLQNGDIPNLIVTDLRMPGMGGHEFVARLKKHDDFKEIPTIVFSTSPNASDVQKCYSNYANAYVVKPQNLDGYKRAAETLREFWFEQSSLPK